MRIEQKKQKKKAALIKAAYTLFLKNGVDKTMVSDIAEEAGVAKGTFYLYFRSKDDIVTAVITALGRQLLEDCWNETPHTDDFVKDIAALGSAILDRLEDDRPMMLFMGRGLRWPDFRERMNGSHSAVWQELRLRLHAYASISGKTEERILKKIYCLISMCGSVAYSSALYGDEELSKLRPVIDEIIRSSLITEI